MPARSTHKPAPQVAPPPLQGGWFNIPAWSYEGCYGGYLLQPASPVDPAQIRVHIQGRALTVSFGRPSAKNQVAATCIYKRSQKSVILPAVLRHRFVLPENVNLENAEAVWCVDTLTIRFACTDEEAPAVSRPLVDPDSAPPSALVRVPIDFDLPVTPIIRPGTQTDERRMLDEGKSFIQDGVRYFPLSVAAPAAQAPPSTLLHWIKKGTKIKGQLLQSFHFAPANRYYISEESIERAANRFIKWPSEKPAGPVTLGEQRDQSGYIHLPDAAKAVGVDHHTMWRWSAKGTAPTEKPLDVIKDPASDQFYIRQRDVSALKKIVPRGGLRAGRRPQPAPHP